jgi:hypothetical protein
MTEQELTIEIDSKSIPSKLNLKRGWTGIIEAGENNTPVELYRVRLKSKYRLKSGLTRLRFITT